MLLFARKQTLNNAQLLIVNLSKGSPVQFVLAGFSGFNQANMGAEEANKCEK